MPEHLQKIGNGHPKKSIDFLGVTPSQQRRIVEMLRTKYSVREISEVLDFNRNLFYYQPKSDPLEAELRAEIETLALQYPTYGYRRITQLLVNQGYPVGYRRVARLRRSFCALAWSDNPGSSNNKIISLLSA